MAKHLEVEIENLKCKLLGSTNMVEDIVQKSITALQEKNEKLAKEVILGDNPIDQHGVQVEEDCLKVLALHQPVATDLRYLIGVLKINNNLERIADLAVNTAERTLGIIKERETTQTTPSDLIKIAEATIAMLEKGIQSLVEMDTAMAKQTMLMGDNVNDLTYEMYGRVYDTIKQEPQQVVTLLNYLWASHHLAQMADTITSIAENVMYMIDGVIVRHKSGIFE